MDHPLTLYGLERQGGCKVPGCTNTICNQSAFLQYIPHMGPNGENQWCLCRAGSKEELKNILINVENDAEMNLSRSKAGLKKDNSDETLSALADMPIPIISWLEGKHFEKTESVSCLNSKKDSYTTTVQEKIEKSKSSSKKRKNRPINIEEMSSSSKESMTTTILWQRVGHQVKTGSLYYFLHRLLEHEEIVNEVRTLCCQKGESPQQWLTSIFNQCRLHAFEGVHATLLVKQLSKCPTILKAVGLPPLYSTQDDTTASATSNKETTALVGTPYRYQEPTSKISLHRKWLSRLFLHLRKEKESHQIFVSVLKFKKIKTKSKKETIPLYQQVIYWYQNNGNPVKEDYVIFEGVANLRSWKLHQDRHQSIQKSYTGLASQEKRKRLPVENASFLRQLVLHCTSTSSPHCHYSSSSDSANHNHHPYVDTTSFQTTTMNNNETSGNLRSSHQTSPSLFEESNHHSSYCSSSVTTNVVEPLVAFYSSCPPDKDDSNAHELFTFPSSLGTMAADDIRITENVATEDFFTPNSTSRIEEEDVIPVYPKVTAFARRGGKLPPKEQGNTTSAKQPDSTHSSSSPAAVLKVLTNPHLLALEAKRLLSTTTCTTRERERTTTSKFANLCTLCGITKPNLSHVITYYLGLAMREGHKQQVKEWEKRKKFPPGSNKGNEEEEKIQQQPHEHLTLGTMAKQNPLNTIALLSAVLGTRDYQRMTSLHLPCSSSSRINDHTESECSLLSSSKSDGHHKQDKAIATLTKKFLGVSNAYWSLVVGSHADRFVAPQGICSRRAKQPSYKRNTITQQQQQQSQAWDQKRRRHNKNHSSGSITHPSRECVNPTLQYQKEDNACTSVSLYNHQQCNHQVTRSRSILLLDEHGEDTQQNNEEEEVEI